MNSLELLPSHAELWKRFEVSYARQKLAHAVLFIAPPYAKAMDFAYRLSSIILGDHSNFLPCKTCKSCRLVMANQHPDLHIIQPDKPGGRIKIDQIRDLHSLAFTSPQLGFYRIIVIDQAENMNSEAANALLKLLEEPPSSIQFVLIAEHSATILPTVLSRCQLWHFPYYKLEASYLALAEHYQNTAGRSEVFQKLPEIIEGFSDFVNKRKSPIKLAEEWSNMELRDLFWLIYLIHAEMISYQLIGQNQPRKPWTQALYQLSSYFQLPQLFNQLDELTKLLRNQKIALNQTLVLEHFFLKFTS